MRISNFGKERGADNRARDLQIRLTLSAWRLNNLAVRFLGILGQRAGRQDLDSSAIGRHVTVQRRADQQIRIAVAVDIPGLFARNIYDSLYLVAEPLPFLAARFRENFGGALAQ